MTESDTRGKFALLTLECAVSTPALAGFIREHRDRIGLVVASRLYRPGHGPLARYFRNWRDSGGRFAFYLSYAFFYAPHLTRAADCFSATPLTLPRLCRELGIDYLPAADVNDTAVREALAARGIRRLVSCYFDQVIGEALIAQCPEGCLNLHPGLLPEYRGLFPEFQAAAEAGAFGYSIHRICDRGVEHAD